jgi:hypothetical protein
MGNNASIPNFANVNQFKVMVGDAAFVVPDTVQQASPSGISSGLSPSTLFDTKRLGVGGYIYIAFSDAAGPTALDQQIHINPGDSIVLATSGGIATVTITNVNGTVTTPFSFAYTTVGGIQGYYS